ncbi:hypothetical protein AHAS_Ahas15G0218400 [Arachis hypogaea]
MPTHTFPSDTMANPRGECKAMTLESGKVVEETSSNHNLQEKEAVNDSVVHENVIHTFHNSAQLTSKCTGSSK